LRIRTTKPARMDDQSFLDHLEELRWRIIYVLIWFTGTSIISYNFSSETLHFLAKPLEVYQNKALFFHPLEPFIASIKVSLLCGLFLTIPFFLWETYLFLRPAFRRDERKIIPAFFVVSFLLFVTGSCFSYFLLIPAGLRILFSFGKGYMEPMIPIGQYLSFTLLFIVTLGVLFNFPVVLILLVKRGIVRIETLLKGRKIAILGAFIFSGVVTPSIDIFTQTLLAIPLIFLYELTMIFCRLFLKRAPVNAGN